jgi:hypothetical protein
VQAWEPVSCPAAAADSGAQAVESPAAEVEAEGGADGAADSDALQAVWVAAVADAA